jgi:hypothetical protein
MAFANSLSLKSIKNGKDGNIGRDGDTEGILTIGEDGRSNIYLTNQPPLKLILISDLLINSLPCIAEAFHPPLTKGGLIIP